MNPEILKVIIICLFAEVAFVLLLAAIKFGWIGSASLSKNGVDLKNNKKEVQRQYEASTIKFNQDVKVLEYDKELINFAIERSDKLRRTIAIELNAHYSRKFCLSTIRALSGSLRYPLYDAARKNNFKDKLKPENSKSYITGIMKEVVEEYKACAIEREMSYCSNDSEIKCPELPSVDSLIDGIENKIIDNWAIPIRDRNVDICLKKIELYEKNIPEYIRLGDEVNKRIAENCLEKNRGHIKALKRKPEPGEF